MRETTNRKYLYKDEIDKLLHSIKSIRDKAILTVMYYRGLRASEIGLLTIDDLRLDAGRLYVHRLKGSISGEHILSPIELKVLRAWMKIRLSKKASTKYKYDNLLFPSKRNGPLDRTTLYRLIRRYGIKVGIPNLHPHMLKHSIAQHLVDSGEKVQLVQDWLGHRSINSTMEYIKVGGKDREEAAKRFYGKG